MKAIFLSGNSIINKPWVEELEKETKDLFESSQIQYYKHWFSQKNMPDIDFETEELIRKTTNLKNYVIIAKSVGAYITLNAINKGITPDKIIFFGIPFSWLDDIQRGKEMRDFIAKIKVSALFIQNEFDPYCSYKELIDFIKTTNLKNYKSYEFKKKEDHIYDDFDKIRELIKKFISEK